MMYSLPHFSSSSKESTSSFVLLVLIATALSISNVAAFAPHQLPCLVTPTTIPQFSKGKYVETSTSLGAMGWRRTSSNTVTRSRSSLFHNTNNKTYKKRNAFITIIPSIMHKLRRYMTILLASTMLLLGPVSHPPLLGNKQIAHASTTTTASSSPKYQKSLDKLINNYVQKHMFADDKFDHFESTYREIITDSNTGDYPNALSSIASNLGATQITSSSMSSADKTAAASGSTSNNDGIMKNMLKLVDTIETKYNIPRSIIVPVMALVCFGVPSVIIFIGLLSFSYAQRGMTERMAIERYGESVLDAEEIAVEDDDDDDDDYDYETGEYEDDDEDDDDEDDDEDDE